MYRLSVIFLGLAVGANALTLGMLIMMGGEEAWILVVIVLGLVLLKRKVFPALDAHGTARWAGEEDLERHKMLDAAHGIIIGRMIGAKTGLWQGIKALFVGKVSAKESCRRFFEGLRIGKKKGPLVRLPPHVVNMACFAPAGAGKSTGLVIPFLRTCDDASCIVTDFSGELALATAEARAEMGEVVILDPYHQVVTR